MTDLLTTLIAGKNDVSPAKLPLIVLANWFFADCAGKNLSAHTITFYHLKIDYLLNSVGERSPEEITTQHLKLLVEHFRTNRNWSVGMTNHVIVAWKVFFNFLEREEIITVNPAKKMKKLKGDQRLPDTYTPEQVKAMLEVAEPGFVGMRNQTMLLVLLDCGLRVSELLALQVDDVDFAQGQIHVRCGKGRKARIVPFSAPVRRFLLKYLAVRGVKTYEEALWVANDGVPLSISGFVSWLRRIAKLTGIHVHPHAFRHTFASNYIANGGHPAYLQRLLGHTTSEMTNRYVHLVDADAKTDHHKASPATRMLGPRWRGSTSNKSKEK